MSSVRTRGGCSAMAVFCHARHQPTTGARAQPPASASTRSASTCRVAQMSVPTGEERRRLRLLAGEVEVLDALRLGGEAVAAGEVVVEVLLARAHAADVEREHGLDELEARLHVVADDDGDRDRDVEVGRALP